MCVCVCVCVCARVFASVHAFLSLQLFSFHCYCNIAFISIKYYYDVCMQLTIDYMLMYIIIYIICEKGFIRNNIISVFIHQKQIHSLSIHIHHKNVSKTICTHVHNVHCTQRLEYSVDKIDQNSVALFYFLNSIIARPLPYS